MEQESQETNEEGLEYSPEEVVDYCHTLPIEWVSRQKNKEFRYQAGLSIDSIEDYVRTIRMDYYVETIDDLGENHHGKLYVFKRMVLDRYWCYIKIKINRVRGGRIILVISFHEDER